MSGDLGDNLDIPFRQVVPQRDRGLDDALIVTGVIVQALTVDLPELGIKPALAFRFAVGPTMHRPIVLVCDDDQLAKLRPLILNAVRLARQAAKKGQPT
jgi:hypothetical protein